MCYAIMWERYSTKIRQLGWPKIDLMAPIELCDLEGEYLPELALLTPVPNSYY